MYLVKNQIVAGNCGSSFIVKETSEKGLFELELVGRPEQKIRFDQTNGNAYFVEEDGTESGYESILAEDSSSRVA